MYILTFRVIQRQVAYEIFDGLVK